ncbi:MAG: hypothetical protein ACT4OJ_12655 [Bacteroidota bacterium]
MNKLLQTATRLLADKRISVLIILTAIAARAIQLLFYLDSFFDTSFQVIATQNFVQGHGISTAIVNPENLSTTVYQPLVNWPPGYSLLLSPFYIATGHNYLIACFIVDMFAATAVIFLCRKILKTLDVSLPVINLFTLFTAFFIYYFYYTGSTDSISIAFFLAALYFSLAAIKANQKWTGRAVIAGCCLLISAGLKYLFFPVVFTIPVFLFIYGWQNRLRDAKKAAFIIVAILAAGITALFLYQQSSSGTGAHISSPGRGFFPEHLLRAHPFIPSAIITPNTVRKISGNAETPVMNLFRIIHLFVYVTILFSAARSFFRHGLKNASLLKTFLFLALSITMVISFALAFLSLLVDKELMPPDRWWTYVEDARYYGLADILVHLAVFMLFQQYSKQLSNPLKYLFLILPFLLLPEVVRGFAFTAKRVISLGKEKYYWQQELGFQRNAAMIIQAKQDSLKVTKTVISGSLYYANYRTSLHQQVPVLEDVTRLNNPASLKSAEPVLLFVIIREDRREAFKPFISFNRTELAGQYNGFYFYTLYVAPN